MPSDPPLLTFEVSQSKSLSPLPLDSPCSQLLEPSIFTFECHFEGCKEKFHLTADLYKHIRAHFKILKCSFCEKVYKSMPTFIHHVRTHTGHKPYFCPLPSCATRFATKGQLKHHLLSKQHREQMTLELMNDIMSWDTKNPRPETTLHRPREQTSTYRTYESSHNKRRHANLNMMPKDEMSLPPLKRMRYSQRIYGANTMSHPTNTCVTTNSLAMEWSLPPLPRWASLKLSVAKQYPSFIPDGFCRNYFHPSAKPPHYKRGKSTAPTAKYYNIKMEKLQNSNENTESSSVNNSELLQCISMNSSELDWSLPPLPMARWAATREPEKYSTSIQDGFSQNHFYPSFQSSYKKEKSTAPTAKYYNIKTENLQNQNGNCESCPVKSDSCKGHVGVGDGSTFGIEIIGCSVAP